MTYTYTNCLVLQVISCSCTCGNKWTHSYPTFPLGGTPSPVEEDKLPIIALIPSQRNFSHCVRCASLGLGIGWTSFKLQEPPTPAPKKPSISTKISSLLDD